MLGLPALTREQHSARHFVLAAHIVGHLSAREPQCFRSSSQTQSISPPPPYEFDRITSAALLKRHFPQPIGAHINIARPHNAVTALSGAGTRKYCSISKSAQSLEPKDRFPQINRQCLAISPSE